MHAKSPLPLLAALLLAWTIAAPTAWADNPQKVGVNAAVNTDANGTPPGGVTKRLVIGEDIVHNERITTDAKGQTQILFVDGSSVSVGPDSDLTIDEFVYDPKTGAGTMTLTDLQGAMRFVGGKLSKQENAVSVHLGTATIGVRGGVFFADIHRGGNSVIVFIFGRAVSVNGPNGTELLYRPGFAIDVDASGYLGTPYQLPPGAIAAILSHLDGRTGSHGGATNVPTDQTVLHSGVSNTISNNVDVSIQQAGSNGPFNPSPPTSTANPPQVPPNQTQIASSQTQPIVNNPQMPPPPTTIAGGFKDAFVGSTGYVGVTAQPFTGTIAYPSNPPQNGLLNASTNTPFSFTLSPLTPGQTTTATAIAINDGVPTGDTATGPATMTADGNFFFANTVALGGDLVFFYGGTPVASSYFTPLQSRQVLAFNLQPDFALANETQSQTLPFLPSFAGGTTSGGVVSPLYVVTPAGNVFGAYNPTSNPSAIPSEWLQASLAISGQGASQSSALGISAGTFATSDGGKVYGSGFFRGVSLANNGGQQDSGIASSGGDALFDGSSGGTPSGAGRTGGVSNAPISFGSTVATAPDGNNNALFGGTSIDGFVLDSNRGTGGNLVPGAALATQNLLFANYGFNQPALAGTVPSGVGTNANSKLMIGFFGGVSYSTASDPYALTGVTLVATSARTNRVLALFIGTDPFTRDSSGVNSAVFVFGGLSAKNAGRSAFVDDNTFGAVESGTIAARVNGAKAPGTQLAMVTANAVPGAADGLLPANASFCQCQYLQWGYWTGSRTQITDGNITRNDQAGINTWIAGTPTLQMPTMGRGSYSGAAIGSVYNNGNSYMAAGGFAASYNFGNNTGAIAISNFDGRNYAGTIAGSSGPAYAGALSGGRGNPAGVVLGSFYGPGAAETGGTFSLRQTTGPSYIASGVFAGKLTAPIR